MIQKIFSVLYAEQIEKLSRSFLQEYKIDFFCICIIENYTNKKFYISNMPKWAKTYYKLSIDKYDSIFSLQNYCLNNYLIPNNKEYDSIQQKIIEKEESFGHFDIYSIIRKTDYLSFIALALTQKPLTQVEKIEVYKTTLHNFEKFITMMLINLREKIFDECIFTSRYREYFNDSFLFKIIITDWRKSINLTDIERRILQHFKFKDNVKEIAYAMSMNLNTCRSHITNIKNKLDVYSNNDLIRLSHY